MSSIFNTVVVERSTGVLVNGKLTKIKCPSDKIVKRQTKIIAQNTRHQMVKTIFGTYINPHCHVLDTYLQADLEKMVK